MRPGVKTIARATAALWLAGTGATCICAQNEIVLTANTRVFPAIGPGFKAVRRDAAGNLYVLTAPGASVSVFDSAGKLLRQVPPYAADAGPKGEELRAIRFGEAMDVDAKGAVYVADRGANAVKIWGPDGSARDRKSTRLN